MSEYYFFLNSRKKLKNTIEIIRCIVYNIVMVNEDTTYRTLITPYCIFWQPAHVGREATAEEVAVDVKKRRSEVTQTRSLVDRGAIKKSVNVLYNRHAKYYKSGD